MNIYPYSAASESVKGLKAGLAIQSIKREKSKFVGKANKVVINWGCSGIHNPEVMKCKILNHPDNVSNAANKLKTFQVLSEAGVATPPFATTKEGAVALFKASSGAVFCRTKLTGNSGEGIVVAEKEEDLVDAKLYTAWLNKKREYRVHVVGGKAIMSQIKMKKKDAEGDRYVKNHNNGYTFAFNVDEEIPQFIIEESLKAIEALKLDFGAVDIISFRGKPYVLEVNTAPGIENTTLERYVEAFKEMK